MLDGDGSLDAGVLPALAAAVAGGTADLAVGRRVPQGRGVWPWHARAGNVLIAALLRRRGVPVHDIAPIRVARRAALLDLGVADRAFGYPLELLLRAGAAGWRIAEFPVAYRARAGGRSKVSGSLRGTVRAAATWPGCSGDGAAGRAALRAGERGPRSACSSSPRPRRPGGSRPGCARP